MENNNCKVSVIIPVYNAEAYLCKCVDSVLSQTLREIEVILVDDGSTDSSGAICDAYSERDSRITVMHLENGGPARARNHGIAVASGEYIGFVDSDDYVELTMLETLYKKAVDTNSDIAMCGYYLAYEQKNIQAAMEYDWEYVGKESIRNGLIRRYYAGENTGLYSMVNKIMRRGMIHKHHITVNEQLKRAEDAWFVFDCLKAAQKVVYLPQAMYFYRQNEASIMHSVLDNQYESWVYTRRRLLAESEKLQINFDVAEFYRIFLEKVVIYCREMARKGNEQKIRDIFRDEMFRNALPYRKGLPIHMETLLAFTALGMDKLAILGYRLWALR